MLTQAEEAGMQEEGVGAQEEEDGMVEEVIIRIEAIGTKTKGTVITIMGVMNKADTPTRTPNTEAIGETAEDHRCRAMTSLHGRVRQKE